MNTLKSKNPIFEYHPPKNKYLGLISIPHSGLEIPEEFQKYIVTDQISLQQDVDFYVHELIDIKKLQEQGIGVLKANIIRTCVDLNRSKELCVLNWKQNSHGSQVVVQRPSEQMEKNLRGMFYSPYYEMLKALINELMQQNKTANIIDLHSMPSQATEYHMKQKPDQRKDRPDFCISDQFGKSCKPNFIKFIQDELAKKYSEVFINDPYKGGHITTYIDESFPGVNNIQIEINRSLYMDEKSFKKHEGATELEPILTNALIELFRKFDTNSSS